MNIITTVRIDLDKTFLPPEIQAVQGDENARSVKIQLYSGGVPYTPPSGVEMKVHYRRPDGVKGEYSKAPDGTDACSVSGNELTAKLAPQVLLAYGRGMLGVSIALDGAVLNTFNMILCVEPNPAFGLENTTITITGNGVHDVAAYTHADVQVPQNINTTDATAEDSDILEGKTAYVNAKKVTGTLKKETLGVAANGEYTAPSGTLYEKVNVEIAGALELQAKEVTPGTDEQIITADDGYDGLSSVTVQAITLQEKTAEATDEEQKIEPDIGYTGLKSVMVSAIKVQEKTATPTEEEQIIEPDEGYAGLKLVTVEAVKLQEKTATPAAEEQTVEPDEGYIGLSKLAIEGDANLKPENIAKDVTIFGVTGTHEGGTELESWEGAYF